MNMSKTEGGTVGMLTDEQSRLLDEIIGQIRPQVGQGVAQYGGQIVPGVSGLQQQGFDQLAGAFGGQTGDALSRMLSGQSAYEVDPAAREKVYGAERALQMGELQDTWRMLEERANFAGAGRSGGLEQAMAQAGADTQLGLSSLYAGLGYQDEQARRAGLESAAGRQGQGLGMWGGLVGQQLGAGQMERGIMGEQLGEGYNRWLASQPYMNPYLTQWAPMAFGVQSEAPVQEGYGFGVLS